MDNRQIFDKLVMNIILETLIGGERFSGIETFMIIQKSNKNCPKGNFEGKLGEIARK